MAASLPQVSVATRLQLLSSYFDLLPTTACAADPCVRIQLVPPMSPWPLSSRGPKNMWLWKCCKVFLHDGCLHALTRVSGFRHSLRPESLKSIVICWLPTFSPCRVVFPSRICCKSCPTLARQSNNLGATMSRNIRSPKSNSRDIPDC